MTSLTVLRVLAPFLVATHTGLVGVVIEKILALLVVGMHDGDVVVYMAVPAILLVVVVPVIVVTSGAVIFHPDTVGRVIEDDEPPLALVNDTYGFLWRGLCVVIVEGNDAHDQACEEQKKRYFFPWFLPYSNISALEMPGGCPLGIPAMDLMVLNDGD